MALDGDVFEREVLDALLEEEEDDALPDDFEDLEDCRTFRFGLLRLSFDTCSSVNCATWS